MLPSLIANYKQTEKRTACRQKHCSMSDNPKASAVLLSYKRRGNLRKIFDQIAAVPSVTDVVVCNNDPEIAIDISDWRVDDGPDVSVFTAARNCYTYGRFLAMSYCWNDTVLLIDDDQLLTTNKWEILLEAYRQQPTVIHAVLDREHYAEHHQHIHGDTQDMQIGFGSIVNKQWRRGFDEYGKTFARYGEVLKRKADRIFAMMMRSHHIAHDLRPSPLEGSDGAESLHRLRDSAALTREARRRCIVIAIQKRVGGRHSWEDAARLAPEISQQYRVNKDDAKAIIRGRIPPSMCSLEYEGR